MAVRDAAHDVLPESLVRLLPRVVLCVDRDYSNPAPLRISTAPWLVSSVNPCTKSASSSIACKKSWYAIGFGEQFGDVVENCDVSSEYFNVCCFSHVSSSDSRVPASVVSTVCGVLEFRSESSA